VTSHVRLPPAPAFPRLRQHADKPSWQRSLDRVLVRVGDGIELIFGSPASRSHHARSRRQVAARVVIFGLVGLVLAGAIYYLALMR
jgi:hypothetical protein